MSQDREPPVREPMFGQLSAGGLRNMVDTLRGESMGGVLLIVGAALALVWANSPWQESYATIRDFTLGSAALHLELTMGQWAADGLLAIFFFVVGVELKREIVTGELRRFSTAIVPVAAAVGGMAAPALIYLAWNLTSTDGAPQGWAIPTATDIAFAVAVLSLVGKWLPSALRAFLLTLAVVDDLLAIIVIALFYSEGLALWWLVAAAACVAAFALLVRCGITRWYALIPLGVLAWYAMHASGIHATIAGVALGMVASARPLRGRAADRLPRRVSRDASPAEYFEHIWRPISSGMVVPIFALFTAGVAVDPSAWGAAWADPVARGVALGLLLGKPAGILSATWLISRSRRADLAPGLGWADVLGIGVLAGIGFTVSLLVAELAFGVGHPRDEHAKIAILTASLLAALLGSLLLTWRGRVHRANGTPLHDEDENSE